MTNSRALLATAALALAMGGCSLALDIDEDCDRVSDCGAYVCNSVNTACLSTCLSDLDCSAGNACDFETGRCEVSQCTPMSDEPVQLSGVESSFEQFRADAAFNTTVLFFETDLGVFARRFRESSGALSPISQDPSWTSDDETITLEAIEIQAFPPVGLERVNASVALIPGSLSGLPNGNRLHFLWAQPTRSDTRRQRLRSRAIDLDAPCVDDPDRTCSQFRAPPSGDTGLPTLLRDETFSNTAIIGRPEGATLFWTESRGAAQVGRLQGRLLDEELASSSSSTVDLADGRIRDFRDLDVARGTSRSLVAWAGSTATGNDSRVSVRAVTDSSIGSGTTFDVQQTARRISSVAIGAFSSGAWIVWREEMAGGVYQLRYRPLTTLGEATANVSPQRLDIHQEHAGLSLRLARASRENDFVVAHRADGADGEQDIWISRFTSSGPRGLPFPVRRGASDGDIRAYDVVSWSSGYIVIWAEQGADGRDFFQRAFRCGS